MKNINTDKLIKGEPYLIEAEKDGLILTALGIYQKSRHSSICETITFFFCGGLAETKEMEPFFFTNKHITSLTHLKRGEVIK